MKWANGMAAAVALMLGLFVADLAQQQEEDEQWQEQQDQDEEQAQQQMQLDEQLAQTDQQAGQ
jgi:hypothetical protein